MIEASGSSLGLLLLPDQALQLILRSPLVRVCRSSNIRQSHASRGFAMSAPDLRRCLQGGAGAPLRRSPVAPPATIDAASEVFLGSTAEILPLLKSVSLTQQADQSAGSGIVSSVPGPVSGSRNRKRAHGIGRRQRDPTIRRLSKSHARVRSCGSARRRRGAGSHPMPSQPRRGRRTKRLASLLAAYARDH